MKREYQISSEYTNLPTYACGGDRRISVCVRKRPLNKKGWFSFFIHLNRYGCSWNGIIRWANLDGNLEFCLSMTCVVSGFWVCAFVEWYQRGLWDLRHIDRYGFSFWEGQCMTLISVYRWCAAKGMLTSIRGVMAEKFPPRLFH